MRHHGSLLAIGHFDLRQFDRRFNHSALERLIHLPRAPFAQRHVFDFDVVTRHDRDGDRRRRHISRAARKRKRDCRRQEILRGANRINGRCLSDPVAEKDFQRVHPFDRQRDLRRIGAPVPTAAAQPPEQPIDRGMVVGHVAHQIEQTAFRIHARDADTVHDGRRPVGHHRIVIEAILVVLRRVAVFEADGMQALRRPDHLLFGEGADKRLPRFGVAHAVEGQPHLARLAVVERELQVHVAHPRRRVGDHLPQAGLIGVAVPAIAAVQRVARVEPIII